MEFGSWLSSITTPFAQGFLPELHVQIGPGYGNVPDVVTMLLNLQRSYPQIILMITAFSYLAGIWILFQALYKMKQYGELRTMMSLQTDMRGPLMQIVVGMILIALPTSIKYTLNTFYGTDSIMALPGAGGERWEVAINSVQRLVQVIGLIAFIRGWLILVRVVDKNSQIQGGLAKAGTHILGGILALNIEASVKIINVTFGTNF